MPLLSLTWAMKLFCRLYKYRFSSPDQISVHSQSGNDTNIKIHVGFPRWGVKLLLKISVQERMFTVVPLNSGQCLYGLHHSVQVHIFV